MGTDAAAQAGRRGVALVAGEHRTDGGVPSGRDGSRRGAAGPPGVVRAACWSLVSLAPTTAGPAGRSGDHGVAVFEDQTDGAARCAGRPGRGDPERGQRPVSSETAGGGRSGHRPTSPHRTVSADGGEPGATKELRRRGARVVRSWTGARRPDPGRRRRHTPDPAGRGAGPAARLGAASRRRARHRPAGGLRRGDRSRDPLPLRGLWPAAARGDGVWHACGCGARRGAAGGGRRCGHLRRPTRPGVGRWRDPAARRRRHDVADLPGTRARPSGGVRLGPQRVDDLAGAVGRGRGGA